MGSLKSKIGLALAGAVAEFTLTGMSGTSCAMRRGGRGQSMSPTL